jgi:GTPase Era involved in 16S rRNA processing
VEEFREGQTRCIRTVLCRRKPKAILIGAGGQRIRDIGRSAPGKVEKFVGTSIISTCG